MQTLPCVQTYTKADTLDLSALPLGALRKAQRALAQARADSDASDDDASEHGESDDGSSPEEAPSRVSTKGKARETERAKPDIEKRKNKHACVSPSRSLRTTCESFALQAH